MGIELMSSARDSLTQLAVRTAITSALAKVGVTIDGKKDHDPQIHNQLLWQRIAADGYVGLGDSYMDGWWTCKDLATLTYLVSKSGAEDKLRRIESMRPHRSKGHSTTEEKQAIQSHYDIGLDLYEPMLGPTMQYSCSRGFAMYGNLTEAQIAKMLNLGQKLGLKPGSQVVEVGCGFGSLAHTLNERFGYRMRGMTLSGLQLDYAKQHYAGPDVEFYDQNYQETPNKLFPPGHFDGLISVGMIEHVGRERRHLYFGICSELLKPEGVAVIHGICGAPGGTNSWIEKHIFQGGYIPEQSELVAAATDAGFVIQDIENIGLNYDQTLLAWRRNVMAVKDQLIASGKYDERFFRMWDFYLSTCAGKFRSEDLSVWQLVLTKRGARRPYRRVA